VVRGRVRSGVAGTCSFGGPHRDPNDASLGRTVPRSLYRTIVEATRSRVST
jgi:hypothetical protein